MSLVAVWDYLATADSGEVAYIACVLGFVVFPILDGVWSFFVDAVERVR